VNRTTCGRSSRRAADLDSRGFTLTELLMALAMAAVLAGVAIPSGLRIVDDFRARGAATYLAHRLGRARIEAIKRSAFVGLRFEASANDYSFTSVADGNDNGLRTNEIVAGTDPALTPAEFLGWNFPGVTFGLLPGTPDADGSMSASADGVRVGASAIVSMNPNGSSSSGTLYVRGRRRAQYAVRVLGATGRVRMMKYLEGERRWREQ
jgi:prepilin-type N-terminal cleavage/methylation domain-containing protein